MIGQLLKNEIRFLTFRVPDKHLREHPSAYLAFGLLFTWIAGVGRYWDNPRAELWQYLGLGSVAYVFVLAGVIWLLVAPLKPYNWSYRNVLLCISLTAPPAVLYAIPVERFMTIEQATSANAWFLAIVAAWRVALYGWFLRVLCGLKKGPMIVALLLPLTLIVVGLAYFNLEHVVFRIMGGIREDEKSVNDAAYAIVWVLTFFSIMASPVILAAYAYFCYKARQVFQKTRKDLDDHKVNER